MGQVFQPAAVCYRLDDVFCHIDDRREHAFNSLGKEFNDFSTQIQPVKRQYGVHNGLYNLWNVLNNDRDIVNQALHQLCNQLCRRFQQLGGVVVYGVGKVGDDFRDYGNQVWKRLDDPIRQGHN